MTKAYLFLIISLLVLNPNILVLTEAINREQNPCKLIRPYSEEVRKLRNEILPYKNSNYIISDSYCVANYVLTHINYSFDWPNWGIYEYFPTPEETIERGMEDCDGLAILVCSILRSMDLDAWVVFGVDHAWVRIFTENSHEDLLGSRPPEFLMFNEERIIYLMTDIDILINRVFPPYAFVNEISTIILIIGSYMMFFIVAIPEEYSKEEKTIPWLKKSGFLKPSKHAWMGVLSLLTIITFSLISIKIPQAFYVSLIGLTSLGITTVYRMDNKKTKKLCFILLVLVVTLLSFENIQEANAMVNLCAMPP